MKWLKKNWLKIIIIISIAWLIISYLDGRLSEKQYKQDIENLDYEISRKERANEVKDEIIAGLEGEIERKEVVIAEKDKARAEGERENARIALDRDKWKAKVKDLPASIVVVETRVILETDEVWERPEGILFSLSAAKTNLAILGDFSLVEEDRDKWRDNYGIAVSEIADLKGVIVDVKNVSLTKDGKILDLNGIITDWTGKFNRSEKRNVQSWWRGAKLGAPIGGGIVLLLWLVFGK